MDIADLEQRLREHPGDLASWEAYGDLILERGDLRGALIRLERRRAHVGAARRDALDREITALVQEHQQSWDATLPPGATVLERRYGFATKVSVEWSNDVSVLTDQALRAPFVTALRIAPPQQEGDYLEEEEALEEDQPAPFIEAGALATVDLGRLSELDLSYLRIGALGAEALAVSTYLRAEAPDIGALASSTAQRRMETLDLRYCHIGDAGLAALAASPCFNGVRRLHLQKNVLTPAGIASLHRFERLTELDLRYNGIGEEGARALLSAPFIGSLTRLFLYRADVEDAGATMLANAPQLPLTLRNYWRSV